MSRLAKHLKPSSTGRRSIEYGLMPSLDVREMAANSAEAAAPTVLSEYAIEARLRATCLIDDRSAQQADSVWEDAVRSTRRKIVEEVFGEFRPMLYQLNEATHKRDWAAVNRGLRQIYDTMFEEGL